MAKGGIEFTERSYTVKPDLPPRCDLWRLWELAQRWPLRGVPPLRARTTVLLGAGAGVALGGPSTTQLTDNVRAVRTSERGFPEGVAPRPFLACVARALDKFLHEPDFHRPANFEDVFHAIEMLGSYSSGWAPGTVIEYQPRVAAFVGARAHRWFNMHRLLGARDRVLQEVGAAIAQYSTSAVLAANPWAQRFWDTLADQFRLDVINLNYDDLPERALGSTQVADGFVGGPDRPFQEFDPRTLDRRGHHRVLQLHGSARFGYPRGESLTGSWSGPWTLVKYPNARDAMPTWKGRSLGRNQAGEEADAGPIVVGLRKPDKVAGWPYAAYLARVVRALETSRRLVIVGYGFGDLYLNELLRRWAETHGTGRRAVLVDYIPARTRECWHPDYEIGRQVEGWPSKGLERFLSQVGAPRRPFTHIPPDEFGTDSGTLLAFLQGWKPVGETQMDRIAEFLWS